MDSEVDPIGRPKTANTGEAIRLVAWILAVPALAIAYYFSIALPAYNEGRLALERQRHAEDLKRSEDAAKEAESRREHLLACLERAETQHVQYLKLNGTELKDGNIQAPENVFTRADKRRNDDRDACYKLWAGEASLRR